MGFYPESDEEAIGDFFKFLISPIMLPVTFGTAVYDMMEGTEHLDRGETLRNTAIWGALAFGVHAWNQYIYPGMYHFRSAAKGFQLVSSSPLAKTAAKTAVRAAPVAVATLGLAYFTYAYAHALARMDFQRQMLYASGMDPGSMTQPIYQPTNTAGVTY